MKLLKLLAHFLLVAESRINHMSFSDLGGDRDIQNIDDVCCQKIQSMNFGQKSLYTKTGDTNDGKGVWKNGKGQFLYYSQIMSYWLVNDKVNSRTEPVAYQDDSHYNSNCPTDRNGWQVANVNKWKPNKNFLSCIELQETETDVMGLSESICVLLQSNKDNANTRHVDKRTNNLCNRAFSLAKRAVKKRKCTNSGFGRRLTLHQAIDTVRQWRDQLIQINNANNSECIARGRVSTLQLAIQKYYQTVIKVFTKLGTTTD
jgi:hypothetical protein